MTAPRPAEGRAILTGGRTRAVWIAQGLIEVLNASGVVRWSLQTSIGGGVSYVTGVDTLSR